MTQPTDFDRNFAVVKQIAEVKKATSAKSIGQADQTNYLLGYMQGFIASLMTDSPEVRKAVESRLLSIIREAV